MILFFKSKFVFCGGRHPYYGPNSPTWKTVVSIWLEANEEFSSIGNNRRKGFILTWCYWFCSRWDCKLDAWNINVLCFSWLRKIVEMYRNCIPLGRWGRTLGQFASPFSYWVRLAHPLKNGLEEITFPQIFTQRNCSERGNWHSWVVTALQLPRAFNNVSTKAFKALTRIELVLQSG